MDIDAPVMRALKRLQKAEGKSLGRLVSSLLLEALHMREQRADTKPSFKWSASEGSLLIDPVDKESVWDALDEDQAVGFRR